MSLAAFWDRIRTYTRRNKLVPQGASLDSLRPGMEEYLSLTGGYYGSTTAISEVAARQLTTVHACKELISGAISSLPKNIYRREGDGEQCQVHNDDLWWTLNEEMCPRWNAASGWEYLVDSLLLRGDAFIHIDRRSSTRVRGLRPIDPKLMDVRVNPLDRSRLMYIETIDSEDVPNGGGQAVYDQDEIIHITGSGFNGRRSLSPLRAHLGSASFVADALQEFTARFFSNGARPDYILKSEETPTEEELALLAKQLDQQHRGLGQSRRPMILTGGLSYEPVTMPMEDVQLLSLRQFQVEEICRALGVPPFMVGHTSKSTAWGTGYAALGRSFVRYTLRPWLHRIQTELNRKLYNRGRKFIAFDTSDFESDDFGSMLTAFRTALGRAGEPAFMTVDEVRQKLRLRSMGGEFSKLQPAQTSEPIPSSEVDDATDEEDGDGEEGQDDGV